MPHREERSDGPGLLARAGLAAGRALAGGRVRARLAALREAQHLSADELRARQDARLRRLVRHAFETVPFWRQVAHERQLGPDDVRGVADLPKLPVVDKSILRGRPLADFCSEAVPAWRHLPYTTSGSTGEPFGFVLDRAAMPLVFATHLLFDEWFGLHPLDRSIRIMGPPAHDPPPVRAPMTTRLRAGVTSRLQRIYERRTQVRLATSAADVARVRDALQRFDPAYVLGYTGTLAVVADELLRTGWRPRRPLKAVVTIAETLTPERRRVLEACFAAPIANRYGQREFKFWCAQSAPDGDPSRFLVMPELVAWESLRADGTPADEREVGRVVLTNLHNEVMPFLRYDTGDLAALGSPGPGSRPGLPVVTRLDGRTQEVLRTPGGRSIDATTLGHHLFVLGEHTDAVRAYQLEQTAAAAVALRVVPAAGRTPDTARLAADLRELLGDEVRVDVQVVGDIPLESSGKRPIIKILPPRRAAREPAPHAS